MSIFAWDESYSVNIYLIDYQHKKLIELVNVFYESIRNNDKKEHILQLIVGLKEYTKTHFATEEMYMLKFDFPGYEAHKNEHEHFVDLVTSFEERYMSGKLIIGLEITSFLKKWLVNHIMQTDKQFSETFIKGGVV